MRRTFITRFGPPRTRDTARASATDPALQRALDRAAVLKEQIRQLRLELARAYRLSESAWRVARVAEQIIDALGQKQIATSRKLRRSNGTGPGPSIRNSLVAQLADTVRAYRREKERR